jgi:hypothetical protein
MPRFKRRANKDGTVERIPFTADEETARDAEEAQVAQDKADYIANEKYKDDRRKAYGDIGAQLDMQYWDGVNDTTVWADHVATVKAAHPKPE